MDAVIAAANRVMYDRRDLAGAAGQHLLVAQGALGQRGGALQEDEVAQRREEAGVVHTGILPSPPAATMARHQAGCGGRTRRIRLASSELGSAMMSTSQV